MIRYRAVLIAAFTAMLTGLCLAGWGWIKGDGLHWDMPDEGAAIIGGGILSFLSALFFLGALSDFRRARAVRARPEGGFHLSAGAIAAFLEVDRKQDEPNEWRPAFGEMRRGVDISWAGDSLLFGGRLWGFAPERYPSVYAIEMRSVPLPHVAIRYRQLWIDPLKSHSNIHNTHRTFRFPITDESAARALVRHFLGILAAPSAKRGRDKVRRARIGLAIVGALCIVVGGGAFGQMLYAQAQGEILSQGQRALAIGGAVFAILGGPIFLGLAWAFRDK